jgi:hypothetical protein
MELAVFGFEPGTFTRLLVVVFTTLVTLVVIMAVAWRRASYWWVSMSLIVASCAGLALGSYFAVRIFTSTLDDMGRAGGGIVAVNVGVWQSTQPILAAAWCAIVLTLFAIAFVAPRAKKELPDNAHAQSASPARFALLALFAFAFGFAPVLLFRRAIAFVFWAVTPGAHAAGTPAGSVSQMVANRLWVTATISACGVLILIALLVLMVLLAHRSNPSRSLSVITMFALVVNLGLSAALVVNLTSFSNRYRAALTGQIPSE